MPIHRWTSDNHIFQFKSEDINNSFRNKLFKRIIDSQAFRRLSKINFLGGIDYLVPANSRGVRRHNRFDHTLAVASLAKRYVSLRGVGRVDADKVIAAALLHDIGHAPLSHSLESVFKRVYGVDHHRVGRDIITGVNPMGAEIVSILESGGIDPFEIVKIIEGKISIPGADVFSRSINVDTIEGILRSSRYLNCGVWLNPNSVLDSMLSLGPESHRILDQFWFQKGVVYGQLIQSNRGVVADVICAAYMQENKSEFMLEEYWTTEAQFKRRHAAMFADLDEYRKSRIIPDYAMGYIERSDIYQRIFYVDSSIDLLNQEDIDLRYRQEKRVRKLLTSEFKRTGGGWSEIDTGRKGLLESQN